MFTGWLTKHFNVCSSSLIAKQPDSPVAAAQPDESLLLLCQWSALCGVDCRGTARHFSALLAADLQMAPCCLEPIQGQFGRSKVLNRRRLRATTNMWLFICPQFVNLSFLTSALPLSAVPHLEWRIQASIIIVQSWKKLCPEVLTGCKVHVFSEFIIFHPMHNLGGLSIFAYTRNKSLPICRF